MKTPEEYCSTYEYDEEPKDFQLYPIYEELDS